MGISRDAYDLLCQAASSFESDNDFGLVQVEEIMVKAFGAYGSPERESKEGLEWKQFWTDMVNWEEAVHESDTTRKKPVV